MKDTELSKKVQQSLEEFENMGNIQPSADWNKALMNRINSERQYPVPIFSGAKLAIAFILFIILINIGFLYSSLTNDSDRTNERNKSLQIISKEFMIELNILNN